jgi:cytochrome b561
MNLQALKSNSQAYGALAKKLHWMTAAFFLLAYMAVYYRHWFTEDKTPENWTALHLHLSFGVTIAVVVFLRVFWKLIDNKVSPEPGTPVEHFAAKFAHYLLYLVMIVMPLTGYLGTGINTEFFQLFEITKFADTALYQWLIVDLLGSSFEQIEPTIDFIHKDIGGRWLVWLLIVGHIAAAFYHHWVKKDNTLTRMR